MKYVVNGNLLRIRDRSRNAQPHLRVFKKKIRTLKTGPGTQYVYVYIYIWRLCACLKNCLVVMRIPSSFECLVGILMLTPPQSKKETLSKQGKPHFLDGANSMLWRWRGLDDQLLASSSCVRESRILVRRLSSSSISTNPSTKKKKEFRILVQFAWCCSTWTDFAQSLQGSVLPLSPKP